MATTPEEKVETVRLGANQSPPHTPWIMLVIGDERRAGSTVEHSAGYTIFAHADDDMALYNAREEALLRGFTRLYVQGGTDAQGT